MTSPFHDPAAEVLRNAPIPPEHKADIYDLWWSSPNHHDLARQLQPLGISDDVKRALFEAKQKQTQESANPVLDVINAMAKLPRDVLDFAEKHHVVAKYLIDAALKAKE